MNTDLNSNSHRETLALGVSLGKLLTGSELILLSGNLGAGKTMFTKGIGEALGIRSKEIVSPSYTLMNVYDGFFKLFHIDLYRIGEQISGGIPEVDENLDRGIIVVEWGEFIMNYYSNEKNLININISCRKDNFLKRKLSISTMMNIPLEKLSVT